MQKMNDLYLLRAEFVQELIKCTPEDFLECKLTMFSIPRPAAAERFLKRAFDLAEQERPLLLEDLEAK